MVKGMASTGHPFVDLTDESYSLSPTMTTFPSTSSSDSNIHQVDRPRVTSYMPSTENPAKRRHVDISNFSSLALLNPRAYIGNGARTPKTEVRRSPDKIERETHSVMSMNNPMETLHGLKDRKVKVPPPKDTKREAVHSAERTTGNIILSKTPLNGNGAAPVIDLTGRNPFSYCETNPRR